MVDVPKAQFPDEQSEEGQFVRQQDAFRDWVTADGRSAFPAEPRRYHLYVSWACPWAHRTIIVRHLKRLEEVIGMTVVDPVRDERGWAFREGSGHTKDPVNGFKFLSEAYMATDPSYEGRVTVPVLWDKQTGRIVNNSDDDLLRILNQEFNSFTKSELDLYPVPHRSAIDQLPVRWTDQNEDGRPDHKCGRTHRGGPARRTAVGAVRISGCGESAAVG